MGVTWSEIEPEAIRIAHATALRWRIPGMDSEDLESELVIAAWRAHDRWHPNGGRNMMTYLGLCMTRRAQSILANSTSASRGFGAEESPIEEMVNDPPIRDRDVTCRMAATSDLDRLLSTLRPGSASHVVMSWLIDHPDSVGDSSVDSIGRIVIRSSWYASCMADTGLTRSTVTSAMQTIRRVARRIRT